MSDKEPHGGLHPASCIQNPERVSHPASCIQNPERVSYPESRILDPVSMERIRWRCRRGLLELDIVLGRFIEHYASLDTQQRVVFDTLLDLPDTSLWDMISGKLPALHEEQRELLELINMAGID